MFNDFLLDYQIEKGKVRERIPIKDLPPYRKFFLVLLIVSSILTGIFAFLNNAHVTLFFFVIFIGGGIVFCIIDQLPQNKKILRDTFFSNYDKKKILILTNLLKRYDINTKEKYEYLIAEAQKKINNKNNKLDKKFIYGLIGTAVSTIIKFFLQGGEIINIEIFLTIVLILIFVYSLYLVCSSITGIMPTNKMLCEEIIQGIEYIRIFNEDHNHT